MRAASLFLVLCVASSSFSQAVFLQQMNGEVVEGEGSGVMYSQTDCITAGHVVKFANDVSVRVHVGGKIVPGKSCFFDEICDLALISLEQPVEYMRVEIAELPQGSAIAMEGFTKFATPDSKTPEKLTRRKVLGKSVGRAFYKEQEACIVFSARPHPGMSGGPIYDQKGQLVSIVSGVSVDAGFGTNYEGLEKLVQRVKNGNKSDR